MNCINDCVLGWRRTRDFSFQKRVHCRGLRLKNTRVLSVPKFWKS